MDRDRCVFCRIYDGKEKSHIIYQDDDYIVFSDIHPAAKHHLLIVTREHITDAKSLKLEHKPIVERLVQLGKQVLDDQGGDSSNARFGFHWPPFHSISHLHLHVISPATSMGYLARLIFLENSWWFVKLAVPTIEGYRQDMHKSKRSESVVAIPLHQYGVKLTTK